MERGHNEKMIRSQILRAREHSRKDFLEREKPQMPEPHRVIKRLTLSSLSRMTEGFATHNRPRSVINTKMAVLSVIQTL